MKTRILLFKINIYIFALLFIYSPNLHTQTLTAGQIYKKITDAVVVIHAFDCNNELNKQGSGVVINDKGYVVTNYHVLEGCERLEILHNKEVVPYVDIIGIDVEKDILILKIDAKMFPAIKIGNTKSLKIGQRIYALGSPLGFENTISEGIISGLRSDEVSGRNLIQITASISSGSSGGAVVNDKGELIGISTLTAKEGQNLNFAIPINDVLNVEIGSYSNYNKLKILELHSKAYNEFKKGNYQEAIEYYSKYIIQSPIDDKGYAGRGLVRQLLKDYNGAIQDYSEVIEINPFNAYVYSNRGVVKNKLGDYSGAIKDFNKAIEINPDFASAYYNRSIVKSNLEDYRGAIQDCTNAIVLDPQYASAYINRGVAKANLQDYRGAIRDYSKAIEINPNDEIAYYDRGIAKYNLGDITGACLDWSKAGELGYDEAYDLIRDNCN